MITLVRGNFFLKVRLQIFSALGHDLLERIVEISIVVVFVTKY